MTFNLLTANIAPINAKTIITGTRIVANKPFLGSGAGLIAGSLLEFIGFSVTLSTLGGAFVEDAFSAGLAVDGLWVVVVPVGAFEGGDCVERGGEGEEGAAVEVEWVSSRLIQ